MVDIIAIIILGILVIAQAYERHQFGKAMTNELSKAMKAVMSRNINEYMAAVNSEKKEETKEFTQNDEVELSQASEGEFSKFIKTTLGMEDEQS